MIETIQKVEQQFQIIHKMVNTSNYGSDLQKPDYIERLSIAVEEAYVSLNDGMCEDIQACKTCNYQRNYMRNMMGIFNEIEESGKLSSTVKRELFTFPEKVGEVLSKIDQVLQEIKAA